MKIMIVESPNKIKKISGYLGPGWKVLASVGHIRDLPKDSIGVKPPDYRPQYVVSEGKSDVVRRLKAAVKDASEVYLATDPDREGEAIAWHLKEVLQLKTPKRVTFTEITRTAIETALRQSGAIDYQQVAAQEARRVLDRIVGYEVSPLLSRQANHRLSAGRVQSPAIKLAVMRERQIREFRKRNFYTVTITTPAGLVATLDPKGWCDDGKHIFDIAVAQAIARTQAVVVSEITTKPTESSPRPPFTTSTLQQSASKHLKLSPAETMKLAQSLFEQGAISYHRTDKPNLSDEAFHQATEELRRAGHQAQEQRIIYPSKGGQEAHEAIRPTDFSERTVGENDKERQLYSLIRERALASCMPKAIDNLTAIVISSRDEISIGNTVSHAKFHASGTVQVSPGWRAICSLEPPPSQKAALNVVEKQNEELVVCSSIVEKQTEPPARFTEATLIAALEKLGIGRPSTYASILENIKNREYIKVGQGRGKKKDDKIYPTRVGEMVVDALECMTFMKLDYTRILEEYLDKIAEGQGNYLDLMTTVHQTILQESDRISIGKIMSEILCPRCGKPVKRLQSKDKKSHFWVHEEDPENCDRYLSDEKGKPVIKKVAP